MHARLLRTALFASTSIGLSVPVIASAQETSQQIGLEEIVVTARRVEENLMEVPIAISAMSGESILERGLTNIIEISQFTPGL